MGLTNQHALRSNQQLHIFVHRTDTKEVVGAEIASVIYLIEGRAKHCIERFSQRTRCYFPWLYYLRARAWLTDGSSNHHVKFLFKDPGLFSMKDSYIYLSADWVILPYNHMSTVMAKRMKPLDFNNSTIFLTIASGTLNYYEATYTCLTVVLVSYWSWYMLLIVIM